MSDHGSQFIKMIVSDRGSQKKWSNLSLAKFRDYSKNVVPFSVFSQFGKKDWWSWNFCENSNQLTNAHFNLKFIFPIKNWSFEQISIFCMTLDLDTYIPIYNIYYIPIEYRVLAIKWIFLSARNDDRETKSDFLKYILYLVVGLHTYYQGIFKSLSKVLNVPFRWYLLIPYIFSHLCTHLYFIGFFQKLNHLKKWKKNFLWALLG